MIVCVCNHVSDRDITRHARAGLGFAEIQLELGVATQCGRCADCARSLIDECSRQHPCAALRQDSVHRPTVALPLIGACA